MVAQACSKIEYQAKKIKQNPTVMLEKPKKLDFVQWHAFSCMGWKDRHTCILYYSRWGLRFAKFFCYTTYGTKTKTDWPLSVHIHPHLTGAGKQGYDHKWIWKRNVLMASTIIGQVMDTVWTSCVVRYMQCNHVLSEMMTFYHWEKFSESE